MDVPKKTTAACHDVIVGDAVPIKQHPYRLNLLKLEYLRSEVKYMLDNDIIEKSKSDWSSPCILVPKPDGTYRLCMDFRKVNSVTKTDSYPIPELMTVLIKSEAPNLSASSTYSKIIGKYR
jgi:hypothetical protein